MEDEALGVDPSQKQVAMDTLLKCLKEIVKNNFIPAFLFLGGAAMVSHFEANFQVQSMCPTLVAIGPKKHWEDHSSEHGNGDVRNVLPLPHP